MNGARRWCVWLVTVARSVPDFLFAYTVFFLLFFVCLFLTSIGATDRPPPPPLSSRSCSGQHEFLVEYVVQFRNALQKKDIVPTKYLFFLLYFDKHMLHGPCKLGWNRRQGKQVSLQSRCRGAFRSNRRPSDWAIFRGSNESQLTYCWGPVSERSGVCP